MERILLKIFGGIFIIIGSLLGIATVFAMFGSQGEKEAIIVIPFAFCIAGAFFTGGMALWKDLK